jgi:hypothetical protein
MEMATQQEKELKRIPRFRSVEEMAEFWDTHDASDYAHELEPVEVVVERPIQQTYMLSIRLDKAIFDELRELAKAKGMGASTLARMWILDELARTRSEKAG